MRSLSLTIFMLFVVIAVWVTFEKDTQTMVQVVDNCVECHRKETGMTGEVVSLYETSVHHRMMTGCAGCHGGDRSQTDKLDAHKEGFVARPDANGTVAMCGRCHVEPLSLFKGSRHFPAGSDKPRLDCAACHGVHTIGSLTVTSEWISLCAGCHGLEYLPELPEPFHKMLALSDDLRGSMLKIEERNLKLDEELVGKRKEIRHRISEIIHPTNLKGGIEKIPGILEDGAALKQKFENQYK